MFRRPVASARFTSVRFTEHLDLACINTTDFHAGPYGTIADVKYATAGWVDWYKERRLHGSLGMLSPAEYEHAHYTTLNPEPATHMKAAENSGRFSGAYRGASS